MRRRGGTWAVGVGLAVVAGCAAPACAQTAAINVPAAPLSAAIKALAEQSGAAIGAPGSLAAVRVRGVRGKMPVAAALHRMLRGTGLRAKAAGPGAWRIEAGPKAAWPAADGIDPPPGPDIIVTATKQPEPASRAALALSVADARTLAAIGDAPDASGVATILNWPVEHQSGFGSRPAVPARHRRQPVRRLRSVQRQRPARRGAADL
ncbi:STN domain-containing protein [Sphingomonas sp. SORGH_AS_0438]|uniref:STN domain-containing protein n=1 Tax=Sphingomonas sp. SORGH_AS_0438 TaxID=3041756 RepID=UPI002858AF58|nr:STN domain-containing protein [Sphingomonas sp. SORGH_AS_0438]MDR6126273.1 hypothetical protein [Sphingomonas sp. SORGH_AS_0438]